MEQKELVMEGGVVGIGINLVGRHLKPVTTLCLLLAFEKQAPRAAKLQNVHHTLGLHVSFSSSMHPLAEAAAAAAAAAAACLAAGVQLT